MKILRFLKNYKKESLLAPLFKMMEAIFDLLVPLVVARIIDDGIRRGDTTYVLQMGGVLLLLAACGLIFSLTAQFFAAKAAAGFGKELRHSLFDHIQKLSYTQLDNQGTSTLITRMTSDVNLVQTQVNMAIRLLLRSPFIVFGAMIMAFFVDGKTAMVFVVAIPVLSVIVYGIMLITIPLYKKVQSRLDKVMGSTRENLDGVRVIRAFNKQEQEVARYNEENATLEKFQLFAGRISTLMNPATYIVINVATIGILWVGGDRVNTGSLTQGQVVALVNYMSQILIELIKLANLIINLTKAFAASGRIQDIFDIEPGMAEGNIELNLVNDNNSNDGTGKLAGENDSDNKLKNPENYNKDIAVEFENATLKYQGAGESSIENVSFKAKTGQTIGIIGGTGSGKTSLINMIPRFYDPTEGKVKIFGIDAKDYKRKNLEDIIGVVPQKALLFKGTIRSNLLWGNENATEEELVEALKLSQSYDFVKEKDKGIDGEVAQKGKNFSGGQKQRLTIARALVKKPKILILDDSSSALDYATDAKLRSDIKTLKDITLFVVSQRTASIMDADQIVVLDDGKVVGFGTHDELLKDCSVYQEIYQSQFKKGGQSNGK